MTSADIEARLARLLAGPVAPTSLGRLDDRVGTALRERDASRRPAGVTGRARPRLARLLPLSAAALLVALLAGQVTRPPSAFASWTAAPSAVDPAMRAALLGLCVEQPAPGTPERERGFIEAMNALPMVLVDRRGTSAVALFAGRGPEGVSSRLCLGSEDASGVLRTAGSGASEAAQEQPAAGKVHLVTRLAVWSYGGERLTAAMGTVAPGVARVVVSRDAGADVTATVDGGYWVAWWPGASATAKVTAYGSDGSVMGSIRPDAEAPAAGA